LQAVLETLLYIKQETSVWLELTTLIIPGENDSAKEIEDMTLWVVENLGPNVPMHFTAFHPDWKMRDKPRTPIASLLQARQIALKTAYITLMSVMSMTNPQTARIAITVGNY